MSLPSLKVWKPSCSSGSSTFGQQRKCLEKKKNLKMTGIRRFLIPHHEVFSPIQLIRIVDHLEDASVDDEHRSCFDRIRSRPIGKNIGTARTVALVSSSIQYSHKTSKRRRCARLFFTLRALAGRHVVRRLGQFSWRGP